MCPSRSLLLPMKMFERKVSRKLAILFEYTPGINTSLGEGHRDAVVFRGVRSTADFYQDGVRDDVQYYRPLYNVEQGRGA
jgi:catecholate siderophore receptor